MTSLAVAIGLNALRQRGGAPAIDDAALVALAGQPASGTWTDYFTQDEHDNLVTALEASYQWFIPRKADTMSVARDGTGGAPSLDDAIGQMQGQSTGGADGSAPTDGQRPLLKSDGTLTFAEFDGTDDQIALGAQTAAGSSADLWVAAKARADATGAVLQDADGNPFWGFYQNGATASASANIAQTMFIGGAELPTRDHIYDAIVGSSTPRLLNAQGAAWTTMTAPVIGGSTFPSHLDLYEYLIGSAYTQEQRNLISRYFRAANGTANQDLLVDAANTTREVDIFLIVGQSNARGTGVSGTSPAVTTGRGYAVGGGIAEYLADPVGWGDFAANTGSAWPAFANEWFTRTNRTALFLPCAVGGTALVTGSPRWAVGGDLRANAKRQMTLAESLIATFNVTVSGRYALWSLGETDGDAGVTEAAMTTALGSLVDEFVTDLSLDRFVISRTGVRNDGTLLTEYAAIRAAQEAVVTARSSTALMGFRGAIAFPSDSKMADTYHYTQPGYDEMGAAMAVALDTDTADPEPV